MILAMDNGASVLITCIVVLATIGLGVLLFFFIRKNLKHFKEEDDIIVENAIPKTQMLQQINKHLKRVGSFGAASFMYVDIDAFHDLNELFGMKACDEILREVATRIIRVLPYKATLTRYQNDEFLIFIRDEDNQLRNEKLCKKILDAISIPFQVLIGEKITLTASIGVCTFPQAGANFNEIYSNLELTTFVSKRNGGNKFTNYYATLSEDEKDNMAYYKEIKQAIQNKEFVLYYQPIIDFQNRVIVGAEALMRWNHPTQGVLSPQKFIKVMEQSGDIRWVGEWGIDTMIKFQEDMAEKFPAIPMIFSLNLSTKQLLDPNLANNLIAIATKHHAKPGNFMLEITDFMIYEKIGVIKTNIFKLKDYGFKIAVDGFVLDGQSVQSIQRSPVDVVKLGRGFLKDISNNFMKEKLLEILMKFSKDNNRTIISEGIEGAEIVQYVKNQGIDLGSGYYFAKPLAEADFENYIDKMMWRNQLDAVANLEDKELYGDNPNETPDSKSEEPVEQEQATEEPVEQQEQSQEQPQEKPEDTTDKKE